MPRSLAHKSFNLLMSSLTSLMLYPDLLSVTAFTLTSLLSAKLPDVIEPPINKYHRGIFHSWTALITAFTGFAFLINNPLSGFLYGYSLHVLLDKSLTRFKRAH